MESLARQAAENIKKANPTKFELFKLLILAHQAKDQKEIEIIRQALDYVDSQSKGTSK